MGSSLNKIFGGGKSQTNFKDMMKMMELDAEMNRTNQYGPFGSWEWEEGPGGRAGQRYTMDPGLQAGKESLMKRIGGDGSLYEGYSSPSGLQGLLDSRMKHQYERMNMQAPQPQLGQPGGMPGSMGPSQLPAQPAQPQPMPPGGQGPMPPGAGPGPMPPGAGPQPGQGQMPQQGQMGPPGPQGPAWANNQRFGGMIGAAEAGIDTAARNRGRPEDERESVMRNIFGALSGR